MHLEAFGLSGGGEGIQGPLRWAGLLGGGQLPGHIAHRSARRGLGDQGDEAAAVGLAQPWWAARDGLVPKTVDALFVEAV
jgi:hypothetical protein